MNLCAVLSGGFSCDIELRMSLLNPWRWQRLCSRKCFFMRPPKYSMPSPASSQWPLGVEEAARKLASHPRSVRPVKSVLHLNAMRSASAYSVSLSRRSSVCAMRYCSSAEARSEPCAISYDESSSAPSASSDPMSAETP